MASGIDGVGVGSIPISSGVLVMVGLGAMVDVVGSVTVTVIVGDGVSDVVGWLVAVKSADLVSRRAALMRFTPSSSGDVFTREDAIGLIYSDDH